MRIYGNADSIAVEGDEDGFHLIVETDEGDRINLRVQGVADELLIAVKETVGEWIAEREDARATWPGRVTQDDLEGYDLSDPKRVEMERQIH